MSAVRIVKVGGSLLDWPELPGRLSEALRPREHEPSILIVGGGRVADVVRGLDRAHALGDERAHALALRALDLSARLLAAIVPGLEVVETTAEALAMVRGSLPVLATRRFLDEDDRGGDPLPRSWDVTTDSIAARVAARLGAAELLLVKSAPLPPGADRREAARLGLVDPAFPAVARGLRLVSYLNLRDPDDRPRPLP
ncbi:MAG TPA: uridylate kinase [Isosphaeraceae bacterium]|nr:uridylate kinase [Isosphaeraceae bacterium]